MGYLLPNGHLLRGARLGGGDQGIRMQEFDWDGSLVWEFIQLDTQHRRHHDIEPLPNGNILVLTRETHTTEEAIAEGRDPVGIVRRYAPDYPAFVGKDLTPGNPLEQFNSPWPVPDGSLRASRLSAAGDQIHVEWDAATCTSFDYQLLFGPLASVSAYELSGAECDIGTSGVHVWSGVPWGSSFFLVVGTDDTGVYESSWNRDSWGAQRNGTTRLFSARRRPRSYPRHVPDRQSGGS